MQSASSSLGDLKRETEQTRADLTQTVEQLRASVSDTASDIRQRLSPESIKAEVSDYVRSRGERLVEDVTIAARRNPMQAVAVGAGIADCRQGDGAMKDQSENSSSFVQDFRDAATRNPISAALIGMGVLWMLTGAKSPTGAANAFRSVGLDRIPDALDNVQFGLKDSAGSVRDAATSTLDAGRERSAPTVVHVADYGRGTPAAEAVFDTARDSLTELFRAQPLALGAIGLAIGAGIAAALPNTKVEDVYLGEVSQTVKTQAAEIAGHQVENATTLASDVVEAASEEARKQRLTPSSAKAAVDDITGRVGRVVDAAKKSVGEKQF
jgi:hypothetical protein